MNEHIGSRVRAARQAKNMTQQQLADIAGVAQTTVSKVEISGTTDPETITKLARALKIPEALLVFGGEHLSTLDPDAINVALAYARATPSNKEKIREYVSFLQSIAPPAM